MSFTRRNFLATAALSSASIALGSRGEAQQMPQMHMGEPKPERPAVPRLPAIICKITGTIGIDAAYKMLVQGSDTLDAALHICQTQEDDPNDHSTGLGGLPNAEGEVQLDACCMHGPTRRSAAVAGVSGIRNASLLARDVMTQSGYSLLTGSDAQRFALAHGFSKEDLTTERTRNNWALWKRIQSTPELLGTGLHDPNWPGQAGKAHFLPASQKDLDVLVRKLEPLAVQAGFNPALTWRAVYDALVPAAEPLYVSTVNKENEISSVSTTSGLPWRLPGAASDVAVMGAGSYLDPEVGSAGSTGTAEANIRIAGAHTIVENMRMGMSPQEAGMDALRRIAGWYKNDMTALRFVEMVYYILRKDGAYASVSLWRGDKTGHVRHFEIKDGDGMRRTEECAFLFDGNPPNGRLGNEPKIAGEHILSISG